MKCKNNQHIWSFKKIFENKIHIDDLNWGVVNVIHPEGIDPSDPEIEFKSNAFSVLESCCTCKEERIVVFEAKKIITKSDKDWGKFYGFTNQN